MNEKKIQVMDIALCALTILMCVGSLTVFHGCGAKEDGSFMTCHWANVAVTGVAAAMAALSLLRLAMTREAKRGADAALAIMAALCAVLPGALIPLCMMATMRCHTLLRPGAIVCAALIFACAVADILMNRRKA